MTFAASPRGFAAPTRALGGLPQELLDHPFRDLAAAFPELRVTDRSREGT